nr:proton pump-interactor 1-like [Ipomoea batatas]
MRIVISKELLVLDSPSKLFHFSSSSNLYQFQASRSTLMGKKTYVVFVGRCPRVYDNWEDAKAQVHRFSDNLYKSFPSKDEAIFAFNTFNQRQLNSSVSFVGESNAASTSSSQNSTAAGNNSSPLEPVEILSGVQNELLREFRRIDAIIEEFKQMCRK